MIDYSFKSLVVKFELDKLQKQVSKSLYFHSYPNKNVTCELSYHFAYELYKFYFFKYKVLWEEAEKINHSLYQRTRRLKKYITNMLTLGDCQFLTFTFRDDVFVNTSSKTRKTYVTRFLKSFNSLYVANLDFGGKFKREHYHAVLLSDYVDYVSWKYGNLDGEVIKSVGVDTEKVSKYVSKATNHALKETTNRSCLIYSRLKYLDFVSSHNKEVFSSFIDDSSSFEVSCDILPFTEEYYQDDLF